MQKKQLVRKMVERTFKFLPFTGKTWRVSATCIGMSSFPASEYPSGQQLFISA